jgi:hypothetical protein
MLHRGGALQAGVAGVQADRAVRLCTNGADVPLRKPAEAAAWLARRGTGGRPSHARGCPAGLQHVVRTLVRTEGVLLLWRPLRAWRLTQRAGGAACGRGPCPRPTQAPAVVAHGTLTLTCPGAGAGRSRPDPGLPWRRRADGQHQLLQQGRRTGGAGTFSCMVVVGPNPNLPGAGAQVVDVNYSNKGTRTGGVGTFSSMVVVGNYRVRLGVG